MCESDRFKIFEWLIPYVKKHENIDRHLNWLNGKLQTAKYTVTMGSILNLFFGKTLKYALYAFIPWILFFWILSSFARDTQDIYARSGKSIEDPVTFYIVSRVNSIKDPVTTCILTLLTIVFIVNGIVRIVSIIEALKTIKDKTPEIAKMNKHWSDSESFLNSYFNLSNAPTDYRSSEALEFFCHCYRNEIVSTVGDAVKLYVRYCADIEKEMKRDFEHKQRLEAYDDLARQIRIQGYLSRRF